MLITTRAIIMLRRYIYLTDDLASKIVCTIVSYWCRTVDDVNILIRYNIYNIYDTLSEGKTFSTWYLVILGTAVD